MKKDMDTNEKIVTHLLPWIQRKMPDARNIALLDLEKPGMGLSNETYLFNISWDEGSTHVYRGMVLRTAPRDNRVFPDYHLDHQFLIMQALKNSPIPVPEMYWMEHDPGVIGTPFYIMERLAGDMPKDYPSYHGSGLFYDARPEERAKMWWGSLDILAETHRVDWRKARLEFLGVPGEGTGPIDRQLAYWKRYLAWIKEDQSERYPVIEETLRWLHENRYAPERVCLCWGDARLGNTLYRVPGYDVVAALDWEMAFLGDPVADLAWFIFLDRYLAAEYGIERLAGLPGREETIRRYEERTGWKVNNFHYNEVFCAMRFGMIIISVVKRLMRMGMSSYRDVLLNNFCTRWLAEQLGLPSPGPANKPAAVNVKETLVSIQFDLTGPNGSRWHIISDRGNATRHDGTIENPTCTVRATADDWHALQAGTLSQLEAWKTGRLVINGDLNVMIELRETISRLQA